MRVRSTQVHFPVSVSQSACRRVSASANDSRDCTVPESTDAAFSRQSEPAAQCASADPQQCPQIDLVCEGLITLTEATSLCPRWRMGRKPARSTVYRWATRGCRGVYLETLDTPGGLVTTKPALLRFFNQLKHAKHPSVPQPRQILTEQQHDKVEAELKRRFRI